MESEKRRASSSSSSLARAARLGGDVDQLANTEIEAAETLVDLAKLAMHESGSDSGEKWWNKCKHGRKRLTRESPTPDSGLNTLDSVSTCPYLSEGQDVVVHQLREEMCTIEPIDVKSNQQDVYLKQVKVEKDADSPKISSVCTTSSPLVRCCKSRRNLTEEEKEAQRIRRVLANRESARKTICRRQALCEEMTRKAANLALENENLKREKELALKEYQSLETTNRHLKDQVRCFATKSIHTEVEKTPVMLVSSVAGLMTSSSGNSPWILSNHFPVTQLFWPSIIQSSSPTQLQHRSTSSITIPSNVSMPCSSEFPLCQKQNKIVNDKQTENPLYMLPCPWFFPLPEFGSRQPPPSIGLKDKQDGLPVDKQYSTSSSFNTVANNHVALPMKLKTEASVLTEARLLNDPNHHTPRFPLDGIEQRTGCHIIDSFHGPSLGCIDESIGHSSAVEHESGLQSHSASNTKISSTVSHIANSLLENKQEQFTCPSKNPVDAVAAAEARKRRKKLTKLKCTNGRQCRMHC